MKENSFYAFEIERFFEYNEIKKEMSNIYRLFKRKIEKNSEYKGISFIIGISNTDENGASVSFVYTGKKGRPKKNIVGKKISYHFHIYVACSNKSCSTFCNEMKDILIRKKGYVIYLRKHTSMVYAFRYVLKQCSSVWTYGDFYFKKLVRKIEKEVINKRDL